MEAYKAEISRKIFALPYPREFLLRVNHLVCEAESNAHYHSGGAYATEIEAKSGAVKVVVRDSGRGIDDIDKAMQPGYSTASGEGKRYGIGGGYGLVNMKNADYLDIKTEKGKGTVITMIFLVGG